MDIFETIDQINQLRSEAKQERMARLAYQSDILQSTAKMIITDAKSFITWKNLFWKPAMEQYSGTSYKLQPKIKLINDKHGGRSETHYTITSYPTAFDTKEYEYTQQQMMDAHFRREKNRATF